MTLAENMAVDVDAVLLRTEEHGETVVYRPSSGGTKDITAIVQWAFAEEQNNDRSSDDVRTGQMWISQDATNGIETPTRDDEVTIDGDLCSVVGDSISESGMWRMSIRRTVPFEVGASRLRHPRL